METKTSSSNLQLIGCAALALGLPLTLAVWLIGEAILGEVVRYFFIAVSLAIVIAAAGFAVAFILRAKRKTEPQIIERQVIKDGTTRVIERHTIDGRPQPPAVYNLPSGSVQPPIYPAALRASFIAGTLQPRSDLAAGSNGHAPNGYAAPGMYAAPSSFDPPPYDGPSSDTSWDDPDQPAGWSGPIIN